jgi:hypothetical protein
MAEKAKKTTAKQKNEATKSNIDDFLGGLPVNLKRKMTGGSTLLEVLQSDIKQWLSDELKNQEKLCSKLREWRKMFRGKREPKHYPFQNCANVAVPITRINADTVAVRMIDGIYGNKKVWMVKPKNDEFVDVAPDIEDGLDWWQKDVVRLRQKLLSPLLQSVRTGTGIVKLIYERKHRTSYRYATLEERENPNKKKYKLGNGELVVKVVETTFDGVNVYPIPRDDFIISSNATTIDDAHLVGFRRRLKRPEIDRRVKLGVYLEEQANKLVVPDKYPEHEKDRAEEQGKEVVDSESRDFEVWELWTQYDVDEDGEDDSIVIYFHAETGTVLNAIYNPTFANFRPFIDFTFYPVEYSFDGEGACQILESIQKEIDDVHNRRLDRLTEVNAPMIFVQEGAFEQKLELDPGKVVVCNGDPNQLIREFKFSDTTPSTVNEENMLVNYGQQSIGVTPHVLGMPTSERPVAKDTLSKVEEANKKFKFGTANILRRLEELGYKALEMYAQYQPTMTYYTRDGDGILRQESLDFPLDSIRDGLDITLTVSGDMMSQEIRREIGLQVYTIVSDYYTKLAGMAQALVNPMMPPAFKKFVIAVSQIGSKMLERVLRDFDIADAESIIVALDEVITQEDMMQPPPQPPPGQPQVGAGQPQQQQQQGDEIPEEMMDYV